MQSVLEGVLRNAPTEASLGHTRILQRRHVELKQTLPMRLRRLREILQN
jgi:hypothetical protein